MSRWGAFVGRVSLFPALGSTQAIPNAFEIFKRITGTDPDVFQKAPTSLGTSNAQGNLNAHLTLSCSVNPSRVDIGLNPMPVGEPNEPPPVISVLEDIPEFYGQMERLIDSVEGAVAVSVNRLAVFAHFGFPSASIAESNKALLAVIPKKYQTKLTDEEDFILQVNRPRASKAREALRLNFINKWSADRFTLMRLQISAQSPSTTTLHPDDFFMASVVFDYNTATGESKFDPNEQPAILRECFAEVKAAQAEFGLASEKA
jgi:hypothetical protein